MTEVTLTSPLVKRRTDGPQRVDKGQSSSIPVQPAAVVCDVTAKSVACRHAVASLALLACKNIFDDFDRDQSFCH
jgi:hypothetical protein